MVSVTSPSDFDDDVHVVDYALNLGLTIISNDLYRDLVLSQASTEGKKRLQKYLDLNQFKFMWHSSYFHIHRRRSGM